MQNSEVLYHLVIPMGVAAMGIFIGMIWYHSRSRLTAVESEISKVTVKLETMVSQTWCGAKHQETWQHLEDLLRPIEERLALVANGKLDEVASALKDTQVEVAAIKTQVRVNSLRLDKLESA